MGPQCSARRGAKRAGEWLLAWTADHCEESLFDLKCAACVHPHGEDTQIAVGVLRARQMDGTTGRCDCKTLVPSEHCSRVLCRLTV